MSEHDYKCYDCGCTFDIPRGYKNRFDLKCPDCDGDRWGLIPQSCGVAIKGDIYDWSNENNGKGRRISQLDHGVRAPFYAKSQQKAMDEASRRGLTAIKAR